MFMLKSDHEKYYEEVRRKNTELHKQLGEEIKAKNELKVNLSAEFEFKEKKAVAALENRMEKEKMALEKKFQADMAEFKENELAKMYDKLSGSLTKLHEEGNANTKFIQEMNIEMAKSLTPALTHNRNK